MNSWSSAELTLAITERNSIYRDERDTAIMHAPIGNSQPLGVERGKSKGSETSALHDRLFETPK